MKVSSDAASTAGPTTSLCNAEITLDPWLLVSVEQLPGEAVLCPITGGHTIEPFNNAGKSVSHDKTVYIFMLIYSHIDQISRESSSLIWFHSWASAGVGKQLTGPIGILNIMWFSDTSTVSFQNPKMHALLQK